MKNKLVAGAVGINKFIGKHRIQAARSVLTPCIDFDACVPGTPGNFDAKIKLAMDFGFERHRIYPTLEEMLHAEKGKLDFVSLTTPNKFHAEQAIQVARAGVNLMVDKPLALTASEADKIVAAVELAGIWSLVTATYCGHAALIEARHRIQKMSAPAAKALQGGRLSYDQAWLKIVLSLMTPDTGSDQAAWRKNPELSGKGGAAGDILSHLLFQLHFITGLKVVAVRAKRSYVVEGKASGMTDDQVTVIAVMENGAEITLEATQFAGGHQNDNKLELWFEGGNTLGWDIREAEILWVTENGGPRQLLTRSDFKSPIVPFTHSMPAMHPEGWINADARLIYPFAWQIAGRALPDGVDFYHPDVRMARNICAVGDAIIESSDCASGPFGRVPVDWLI